MSDQPQSSSRIAQLDGLRGLAILLVLALHFLNDSNHGPFGSFLYRFGSAFRLGWAGVDLFFVLSGFLIGGILLDARSSSNYFSVFYIRRLHRIVPIFYLWKSTPGLSAAQMGAEEQKLPLFPLPEKSLRIFPSPSVNR
jgi:peptidoglycan/LPS O-acetylase OafA/YrhL